MTINELSIRRMARGACDTRSYLVVGAALAAVACSSPPVPPSHQTVEFYRTNKEARQAKVAECANDPGALGKTPDCINAKQAAAIEDIGNLRDLPPMGLAEHEDKKSEASGHSEAGSSAREQK